MKNKTVIINTLICSVLMIMGTLFLPAQEFAGGTGTVSDPYIVETPAHLNNVRNYPAAYFQQNADIDLSGYSEGSGWTPIGSNFPRFTGEYDGNGHTISNLFINRPSTDYAGLFGYLENAALKNIHLINAHVTGRDSVGILAGYKRTSMVSGCSSTGAVSGRYDTGGLVGGLTGLAGSIYTGRIDDSYSSAAVSATVNASSTGGLLGKCTYGVVENCYAAGTVKGHDFVGGLVGSGYLNSISDCYAVGRVTGTGSSIGGISASTMTVSRSFYDSQTTGQEGTTLGTPKTSTEMKQQITFTGWNFTNTWDIHEGETYPFLRWQPDEIPAADFTFDPVHVEKGDTVLFQDISSGDITFRLWDFGDGNTCTSSISEHVYTRAGLFTVSLTVMGAGGTDTSVFQNAVLVGFGGGSGTVGDPFLVGTAEHLNNVRDRVDAHYRQTADISLSGFGDGEGWNPIGYWEEAPFTGSYNGDAHTISNLFINRPHWEDIGLFGYTSGARLDNIVLEDAEVTGEHNTGGLVGNCHNTTINNSSVKGIVTGLHDTGLLVGKSEGSSINGCYSIGVIYGSLRTGGLVGSNGLSGGITNSHSGAMVNAGVDAGGLAGLNEGSINGSFAEGSVNSWEWHIGGLTGRNQGTIQDSYAAGPVNGFSEGENVGGLVGKNDTGGIITRCFSIGVVSGADNTGGLAGTNSGQINDSYYDHETSGKSDTGKGNPRSTADMKKQGTFEGWEFNGKWGIIEDVTYPYLRWEGLFAIFFADKTNIDPGESVQFSGYSSEDITSWSWDFGDGNTSTQRDPIHTYQQVGVYTVSFTVSNAGGTYTMTREYYIVVGFAGGGGTEDNPYLVATPQHLYNVRYDLMGSYRQVADIDLSEYSGGAGWTPIGSVNNRFYGNYNGDGYTISNLFINRPGSYYMSLFGFVENTEIVDVHLKNIQISGYSITGGLVGRGHSTIIASCTVSGTLNGRTAGMLAGDMFGDGLINNCFVEGVISGGDHLGGLIGNSGVNVVNSSAAVRVTGENSSGGLVGYNQSEIIGSYAFGDVTGNNYVGGLVGRNWNNITASHAFGRVTGQWYVGGLAGEVYRQENVVKESFATGPVSGNLNVGGLVGDNQGEIIDCYATGQVTGTGNFSKDIGGLVGYNRTNGQIKNCYTAGTSEGYEGVGGLVGWGNGTVEKSFYDKEVSEHSDTGRGEPKTTSEMMDLTTYSGWNFASVWGITAGSSYPYFQRFRSGESYDAVIEGFDFPSVMYRNNVYEMSLTFRNAGNTSWHSVDLIRLGAVDNHDDLVPPQYWRIDLDHAVHGGMLHTFHFSIVPENTGIFTTQWQMLKDGEFWFGEIFSRDVEVKQRTNVPAASWQLFY